MVVTPLARMPCSTGIALVLSAIVAGIQNGRMAVPLRYDLPVTAHHVPTHLYTHSCIFSHCWQTEAGFLAS
jgi:hypothetical protein